MKSLTFTKIWLTSTCQVKSFGVVGSGDTFLTIISVTQFDEFENQHKSESDETQTLLTEKFDLVHSDLATISDKLTTIDTNIKNMSSALQGKFNALIAAVNGMKASNDTKNDAIIAALQGLVTKVNQNTNNINSLDGRVDALEQA